MLITATYLLYTLVLAFEVVALIYKMKLVARHLMRGQLQTLLWCLAGVATLLAVINLFLVTNAVQAGKMESFAIVIPAKSIFIQLVVLFILYRSGDDDWFSKNIRRSRRVLHQMTQRQRRKLAYVRP